MSGGTVAWVVQVRSLEEAIVFLGKTLLVS